MLIADELLDVHHAMTLLGNGPQAGTACHVFQQELLLATVMNLMSGGGLITLKVKTRPSATVISRYSEMAIGIE